MKDTKTRLGQRPCGGGGMLFFIIIIFLLFFLTFFVFLANIPAESYRLPKSSLKCSVNVLVRNVEGRQSLSPRGLCQNVSQRFIQSKSQRLHLIFFTCWCHSSPPPPTAHPQFSPSLLGRNKRNNWMIGPVPPQIVIIKHNKMYQVIKYYQI